MDAADMELDSSTNPPSEVDRFSRLPDCLIHRVLLNLLAEDVVKTGVLSKRWADLWKHLPGLDVDTDDFQEHDTFVTFVDNFLERNHGSSVQRFKLSYGSSVYEKPDIDLVKRWLDAACRLKVEHLDVTDNSSDSWEPVMSPTVYTCSSLVTLRLFGITLPNPEVVSLPCLKDMVLILVEFTNNLALEKFISKCPLLENLSIERTYTDEMSILRVYSKSLLSFMHVEDSHHDYDEHRMVEIDAPMLKYLRISDGRSTSYIMKNQPSLVQADIATVFNLNSERRLGVANEVQKSEMVRNFLVGISKVEDMTIASSTLEVIYDYSKYVQLPVFCNLYSLSVGFKSYMWEMLPVFLEVCPNLKILDVGSCEDSEMLGGMNIIARPWSLLPSLDYVDIERPLKGDALEMKLVGYFLEYSPNLKRLTVTLDDSLEKEELDDVLEELVKFPRLSSSCELMVL